MSHKISVAIQVAVVVATFYIILRAAWLAREGARIQRGWKNRWED